MFNFIKLYRYIAKEIFNKNINFWELKKLNFHEMKNDFIEQLWWNKDDYDISMIFYDCLFYYLKNKNEDT